VATGALLTRAVGHEGAVRSLAFSPDGKRILSDSEDGTSRLWDTATGQQLAVLGTNPGETVAPALFTPDGQWVVAGSEKEVRLRDGKTGRPLAVIGHHEHPVVGLAVSPDGRRIALVARGEFIIVLWDPANRKRVVSQDS
jgi:WD40 repeat protein